MKECKIVIYYHVHVYETEIFCRTSHAVLMSLCYGTVLLMSMCYGEAVKVPSKETKTTIADRKLNSFIHRTCQKVAALIWNHHALSVFRKPSDNNICFINC